MTAHVSRSCTAFEGHHLLSSGSPGRVALAMKAAAERGATEPVLAFDDATGRAVDFDLSGTEDDVLGRLPQPETTAGIMLADEARGRGRPKLGVIGREVTLLPRHWEWLATQPGGASVALRKLVDEARRGGSTSARLRAAQERAYNVMSAMAGNLQGFEEAARALFANDRARFDAHAGEWPEDVRAYVLQLAYGEAAA